MILNYLLIGLILFLIAVLQYYRDGKDLDAELAWVSLFLIVLAWPIVLLIHVSTAIFPLESPYKKKDDQ